MGDPRVVSQLLRRLDVMILLLAELSPGEKETTTARKVRRLTALNQRA